MHRCPQKPKRASGTGLMVRYCLWWAMHLNIEWISFTELEGCDISLHFLNQTVLSKTSRPENGMSHLPIKMMVILGKCNYVSCTLHLKEGYGLILEFVLKCQPRQVRCFGVMTNSDRYTKCTCKSILYHDNILMTWPSKQIHHSL